MNDATKHKEMKMKEQRVNDQVPTTRKQALSLCRQARIDGVGYASYSVPYDGIVYVTDGIDIVRLAKGPDGQTISERVIR
jgi:hypothetical protein